MNEEIIARLIDQKLARGELPTAMPKGTWGGICRKHLACAACDGPIAEGQIEIEAQCVDGVTRHYHGLCHHLLESARERLGTASRRTHA